jgi:hypothetical protein
MISIIICGRENNISPALRHNIQETIGVVHEIIVIDNSKNEYSIFSAYNKGVALSQYDTLCFMHDDLVFESSNWGSIAINQLQNNVGAVGVAGAPYYATLPGAWWSGGIICQHISGQKDYAYTKTINNALPVVVLDGLWLCIKKELFKTISFDEISFKGFHFYDIDISLQIQNLGYDILSLYNITIRHSSAGNLDQIWLQNALILQKKWKKSLPFSVIKLPYSHEIKIEYGVLEEYIKAMRTNGINNFKIAQFALNQVIKYRFKRLRLVSPFLFTVFVLKHFFKKIGLL